MTLQPSAQAKETDSLRVFLEGFEKACSSAIIAETPESARTAAILHQLFKGFADALDRWRQEQVSKADDFNLFDVLKLTGNEIRHSMILAWLLDWEMTSYGTHAQGKLGFRIFLEQFGLPAEYADGRYRVWRENSGDESRIDVEVAEQRNFVIHIENKIWSTEQVDQTKKEWRDLEKRAESLDCPIDRCWAFYLTPDGRQPRSEHFRAISWWQIANVFKRFESEARADEVKLFARHYEKVLRTRIIRKSSDKENNDVNPPVQ